MKKVITVKLDHRMAAKLARVAKQRHVGKSEVVRDAIAALPEDSPMNALAAFGDAVGCFDGPPDLSTNPDYLDGLGE